MRVIVGITGASGSIYGIRLIEVLKKINACEVHAVVTKSGWQVLNYECGITREKLKEKVDLLHDIDHIGASIASGSFKNDAMIIAPCSMKTLASIAHGISDNLLTRAADVTLKEGRTLVLVPRETPLNAIHLENMLKLATLGVKIIPACPAFYHKPQNLQDIVDMLIGKICDNIHIDHNLFKRWQGDL
ncbi:UbiX family flavin prenyltransferase [Anaerosinus massiliensis]|uniref:UbiX family flavin prenyltransferase n=1 Tax=Massilibacillus massiliensis TaxID=1806837 RepID=UPI000AF14CDC|nr:UbiX family flavin prenyltransferase [Massilibacillus massiliensis]